MKKVLQIFIFLLFFGAFFTCNKAFGADSLDDLDYDFLNNAFSNPNPTTNKQFEDVMQKLENQEPRGLFYRIKKFFNRNNPEFDKDFKKRYEGVNNQPLRIKEAPESKPTVVIGADFSDSKGKKLEAGHYQVDFKEEYDGNTDYYTIILLQGNTKAAEIKAIAYEDDWETPAVVYSRIQNVQKDLIRLIYSNLDVTIQGYIRLKQ